MTAKVVLYYSDNCKYCDQFNPTWEALKTTFDENKIEHDEVEASNIPKEKDIKGYPTIRIESKDGEYEYDGPRNPEEIMANVTALMNGGAVLEGGDPIDERDFNTDEDEDENKVMPDDDDDDDYEQQNGGSNYEGKYKKYKAKYLQLKSFMEKNGML